MGHTAIVLGVATCAFTAAATADIRVQSLGTAPPPAIVPAGTGAGDPVHAAPLDVRPVFGDVSDVEIAPGCVIRFDIPVSHRQIGFGWATWSHGYTGDVYYTNGATSVMMTLDSPPGVDW